MQMAAIIPRDTYSFSIKEVMSLTFCSILSSRGRAKTAPRKSWAASFRFDRSALSSATVHSLCW